MRAARHLVAAGEEPTLEAAAKEAGISRTTAYRYFPNQRALLAAAHPETAQTSLLPPEAPTEVGERVRVVVESFTQLVLATEVQQRTMLRLSLQPDQRDRGSLPLRQGRGIKWISEALEPLANEFSAPQLQHIAFAIRSVIGIEALVWLTDVGGLTRDEAVDLMRWAAQAIVDRALSGEPPPG
ncbi:MAG TPA: helix-turn-helix domain-containing protein [Acidimicrobiales bacterium]|nr:helix-turn-helix domain-containing protein [Acidimicrobiales bacterium]